MKTQTKTIFGAWNRHIMWFLPERETGGRAPIIHANWCDCTGLTLARDHDDAYTETYLRTPQEAAEYAGWLLMLADGTERPVSKSIAGMSPEYADESVDGYDATALDLHCVALADGQIMLGTDRPDQPGYAVLTPVECRLLAIAIMALDWEGRGGE